jgi:hypothetical protein
MYRRLRISFFFCNFHIFFCIILTSLYFAKLTLSLQFCIEDPLCKFWSFNYVSGNCTMKRYMHLRQFDFNTVSGPQLCSTCFLFKVLLYLLLTAIKLCSYLLYSLHCQHHYITILFLWSALNYY